MDKQGDLHQQRRLSRAEALKLAALAVPSEPTPPDRDLRRRPARYRCSTGRGTGTTAASRCSPST